MKNRIIVACAAFLFFSAADLLRAGALQINKTMLPSTAAAGDIVRVCLTINPENVTPKADIIWVVDSTGSMSSGITNIKNNISYFTSQLSGQGIDYRNGLLTFKDYSYEEVTYGFAANDSQFLSWVNSIPASGGGDNPENSLDALNHANAMGWRADASKTIILVTDNTVHALDSTCALSMSVTAINIHSGDVVINAICNDMSSDPARNPRNIPGYAGGMWLDYNSTPAQWQTLLTTLGAAVAKFTNVVVHDALPPQLMPIPGTYGDGMLMGNELVWVFPEVMRGAPFQICFDTVVTAPFSGAIYNQGSAYADNVTQTTSNTAQLSYPTHTATRTASPPPTFTRTYTAVLSPTVTATRTQTLTLTSTPTCTDSPTITCTYSASPTFTPTSTVTMSWTQSETFTVTNTLTFTPTYTQTCTITQTHTFSPTSSDTPTMTATWTFTCTPTLTNSPTATGTFTQTSTFTETFTVTRTFTFTQTATSTLTHTPSFTDTLTLTVSYTYTATATPTATPSLTSTLTHTATPTSTVSYTYTITPTWTLTSTITATFTQTPTRTPAPAVITMLLEPVEHTVNPGGDARFMLVISNTGSAAVNMVLWDTLPANTTFPADHRDNASWTASGNILTYSLGNLGAGESRVIYFTLTAATGLTDGTRINVDPVMASYGDQSSVSARAQSNPVYITVGDIVVYPNPFNPSSAAGATLKFANIPRNAVIAIYSVSGEFTARLIAENPYVHWYAKNFYNNPVSPGIYYYVIVSEKGSTLKTGKIFVVKTAGGN